MLPEEGIGEEGTGLVAGGIDVGGLLPPPPPLPSEVGRCAAAHQKHTSRQASIEGMRRSTAMWNVEQVLVQGEAKGQMMQPGF